MICTTKIRILILLCCIFISKVAFGGEEIDHANCVASYSLGKFQEALTSCTNSAMSSNGKQVANYLLGEMYSLGKGVSTNAEIASEYYLSSAVAGYPPGQLATGHYYFTSTPIDLRRALHWYLASAKTDWTGAGYSLNRAADVLIKMDRNDDAYKCLIAAVELGYQIDMAAIDNLVPDSIKLELKNKVDTWLRDRSHDLVAE